MAKFTFKCAECGRGFHVSRQFDALLNYEQQRKCPDCGRLRRLEIVFPFGLNAGTCLCHVFGVFSPSSPSSWKDGNGKKVVYYPFLVVLEAVYGEGPNAATEICAWWPYWHLHDGRPKYGQWAPWMGAVTLKDLLGQARESQLPLRVKNALGLL